MASRREKQDMLEALAAGPTKYEVHLWGYGGEITLGTITPEQYEFWRDREDLSDHACEWELKEDLPEDMILVREGAWYELDDIQHESGCEFSNLCGVTVYDEKGQEVWSSALGWPELEAKGVQIDGIAQEEFYVKYDSSATHYLLSQSVEKGTFNTFEIETQGRFRPEKLSFSILDIEGWCLVNGVSYESVVLEDTGGYSTTGKGMYFDVHAAER